MSNYTTPFRAALFDMDGTLYLGSRLYDFTIELLQTIRATGGKYLFITNNSSKSVADYVKKLEKELLHLKIENAYLKELRRLRLEDARKQKELQESSTISEKNTR